jgi:uncharacterized protein YoxC
MTTLSATPLPVQSYTSDTIAVVTNTGLLPTVEAISTIVLVVAVLAVLIVLTLVLLQIRNLAKSIGSVARRLERESAPVVKRARSVAENVEFITMAVRTDVQKLTASVSGLNERLREASTRMEQRIQDFNALVELLQQEAEDLALDTAAAVRGVRAGTRSFAGEDREPLREALPGSERLHPGTDSGGNHPDGDEE